MTLHPSECASANFVRGFCLVRCAAKTCNRGNAACDTLSDTPDRHTTMVGPIVLQALVAVEMYY